MSEVSVGELRAATQDVLGLVDLSSVYLATSSFAARPSNSDDEELASAYSVQTRCERSSQWLRCWIKYDAFALRAGPDGLPEDPEDLSPQQIEELYAWRSTTEWVAEFNSLGSDLVENTELINCSAFALVIGPPTVHPYAREHLQGLIAKSPHAAYTLGLLQPITAMPDDRLIELEFEKPEGGEGGLESGAVDR